MNNVIKSLLCFIVLSLSLFASDVENLTLDSVASRVQNSNLIVLENAEKVYQAKLSIDEARKNMLPSLNLWTLGRAVIDPAVLLDAAQEIAPFLVPSNWFRLKETEILYDAEKLGQISLKANEVLEARAIYIKVLMDQTLLQALVYFEKDLNAIKNIIEDRYDLGINSAESLREMKVQHLNVQEDIEKLERLVDFEKSTLTNALGISLETQVNLASISIPDISKIPTLNIDELIKRGLNASTEIKQYDQFIKVIPYLEKEAKFSLLGVPSLSRGTAGGIFDNIPVSSGLGFATSTQIDIIKSQGNLLSLQKKGIEETIKRQIYNLAKDIILNVDLRTLQKDRFKLSLENFHTYKSKIELGEAVSMPEFFQATTSLIQSQAMYYSAAFEFVLNYDKLERIVFSGAYSTIGEEAATVKDSNIKCKKSIWGKLKCERVSK